MANDAKKVSDLAIATTLSSTDRVVCLVNPASTANVMTITVNDFVSSFGNSIPGPYTNDAAASAAGVKLKGLYYDTGGFCKIRLT